MNNQKFVNVEIDNIPEDLYQKTKVWADAHNMTVDDATSYIVCKYIERQEDFLS